MNRKSQLTTRSIVPNDAENVLKLRYELHEESEFLRLSPTERALPSQEQLSRLRSFQPHSSRLGWVTYVENELAGFLFSKADMERKAIEEMSLGVSRNFRRSGIATALLNHLERYSRENSFTQIKLSVMAHNLGAVTLYKTLGFSKIGEGVINLYNSDQRVLEYHLAKHLLPIKDSAY